MINTLLHVCVTIRPYISGGGTPSTNQCRYACRFLPPFWGWVISLWPKILSSAIMIPISYHNFIYIYGKNDQKNFGTKLWNFFLSTQYPFGYKLFHIHDFLNTYSTFHMFGTPISTGSATVSEVILTSVLVHWNRSLNCYQYNSFRHASVEICYEIYIFYPGCPYQGYGGRVWDFRRHTPRFT